MEALAGRAVRKAFPGFGTYAGVVESYDADAGYFRVLYEDGDSEEVDADEMAGILVGGPAMPQEAPRDDAAAGRRPKKRRRGDEDEESPSPSPSSAALQEGGVVLAVPTGDGGSSDGGEADDPATPAEAEAEKRWRVSPGPVSSSSRPLLRRSARQAKAAERAAEMEAAVAVADAADAAEAGRKRPRANGTHQSGRKRPRV